ncbi:MAG: Phosphoserine phosphatase SerB [Betaproteobacteria bacterium]|nr:Phosphoserine phosphatase SerB [Betaproteobacteria bacterium]
MNLVIQGADIATPDLKTLAKLAGASAIEAITPTAFRLRNAVDNSGIAPLCEAAKLDYAFIPDERKLAGMRLCVMDMDSTLITIECIDEIADMQGLKPQVAAITGAAMRGELDFQQSLRRRVALLKGLDASALQRVYDERLKLSPGAEVMLRQFRQLGIKTLLLSGGFTFFTERLKQRLALDYTRSNTLEIVDGKLSGEVLGDIVDADVKRAALLQVRDELGIGNAQIIGLGDGANDLKFMAEAGVSVAYHAKPVVRAQATHALNYVGLDGVLNLFG